jgi:hypothetical protein
VPVRSGRVALRGAAVWTAGGSFRGSAGEVSVGIERRFVRVAQRRTRCVARCVMRTAGHAQGIQGFRGDADKDSLRSSSGLGLRGAPELRSVVLGWGLRSISGESARNAGVQADRWPGRYEYRAAPRSSERGAVHHWARLACTESGAGRPSKWARDAASARARGAEVFGGPFGAAETYRNPAGSPNVCTTPLFGAP